MSKPTEEKAVPRETPNPTAGLPVEERSGSRPTDEAVSVWISPTKAPGIIAFGDLRPGTVYVLPAAEAMRLVRVKGFEFASAADRDRAERYENGVSAATAAAAAQSED